MTVIDPAGSDPGVVVRLRRSDGVILYEHELRLSTLGSLQPHATSDAYMANAAQAEGFGWTLELCDPDGDIAPAGEWVAVLESLPVWTA